MPDLEEDDDRGQPATASSTDAAVPLLPESWLGEEASCVDERWDAVQLVARRRSLLDSAAAELIKQLARSSSSRSATLDLSQIRDVAMRAYYQLGQPRPCDAELYVQVTAYDPTGCHMLGQGALAAFLGDLFGGLLSLGCGSPDVAQKQTPPATPRETMASSVPSAP